MEHFFNAWVQAQRGGNRGTSAKDMLRWLGIISLIASGCFWYPIQWELAGPTKPTEYAIAVSFGTFLVLGPPVFMSFLIPWSPGALLLKRVNAKTPGQIVVTGCTLFLVYYAAQLLLSWWQSRPLVAAAGLATMQMFVGIIATIIAPALLWAPVSSEEMAETLQQDQLVQRYRLQTQADIAYLQGILLDAQRVAAHGLAKVAAEEGGETLAWRMRWLVETIDQTIGEIAHTVKETSGTRAYFPNLTGNQDVIDVLDYVAHAAEDIARAPAPSPARPTALAPVIPPVPHQDELRELLAEPTQVRRVTPPASSRESVEISRETSRAPAALGSPRQPQATATGASAAYATARAVLDGAWKRADLERVLHIRETKAGDFIRTWKAEGLVEELTEPAHRYRWVDVIEMDEVGNE